IDYFGYLSRKDMEGTVNLDDTQVRTNRIVDRTRTGRRAGFAVPTHPGAAIYGLMQKPAFAVNKIAASYAGPGTGIAADAGVNDIRSGLSRPPQDDGTSNAVQQPQPSPASDDGSDAASYDDGGPVPPEQALPLGDQDDEPAPPQTRANQ